MLFSLETLIITVSAGAVAALVVGFVTGYCCGRRCHKDDNTCKNDFRSKYILEEKCFSHEIFR